jgi:hypothetical protein
MRPVSAICTTFCFLVGCQAVAISSQAVPSSSLAAPSSIKIVDDPPGSVLSLPDYPTQPTNLPPISPSDTSGSNKFQWQFWKSCTQERKYAITTAWEDSKRLSDAFASWKPKGDYQAAVDMYMGTESTYKDDAFGVFDYPKRIQSK